MREFLKEQGLEQDMIDKIMAEYGKKINENNDEKEQIVELKKEIRTLKSEISGYKNEIEGYKNTIEDKDKSLENLQVLTDENKTLKAEIKMNGSEVKKEFSKFVMNEVMSSVNDDTDFETALNNYKKENPQYFGETVVKKVQSSPNLNGGEQQPQTTNSIMNDLLRNSRN